MTTHTVTTLTPTPDTAPTIIPTTLVLLDPTSPDGESALELLNEQDEHITLMLLLSGPVSSALRDRARAEDLDMATAGWQYLEQVVGRMHRPAHHVLAMTAMGPSAATELADMAASHELRRVLLPVSVQRYEPGAPELLGRYTTAPVQVAEVLATAR